jgi:hypothetical protein
MAGSEADGALSMEKRLHNIASMTGILLLPAASVPVKWYLHEITEIPQSTRSTEHFLCTLNYDGDTGAMAAFETLISTMNRCNHVLIVRLEYHRTVEENCKYAAIAPLACLCATIGFLKCDISDLRALVGTGHTVETTHDGFIHGTTIFDPWMLTSLELHGDEIDESLVQCSIDTQMPDELKSAIAMEKASQRYVILMNI